MDAILWLLRTGYQWRNLLTCLPRWQAVYYLFDQWKKADLFEHINAALNQLDRHQAGHRPLPSALCMIHSLLNYFPWFASFEVTMLINSSTGVNPL